MEITTVRYGRLYNLGNYENERIEVEAAISPSEDWEEVYEQLKGRVTMVHDAKEDMERQVDELQQSVYRLEQRKNDLDAQVKAVEKRWEHIKRFMDKVGLELPRWAHDEIPF